MKNAIHYMRVIAVAPPVAVQTSAAKLLSAFGGKIIAVDLACVTPPVDSVKFGASAVSPTAKIA